MKLSSFVCLAWLCTAQLSVADDAGSAIVLPSYPQLSQAAQNAAEAPRWIPPVAQTAPSAASIQVPSSSAASNPVIGGTGVAGAVVKNTVVNNPAVNNPVVTSPAVNSQPPNDTVTLPADVPNPNQSRPLVSVMKRRNPPASAVAPATASAAIATSPTTNTTTPALLTPSQVAGAMPLNANAPPAPAIAASTIPTGAVPAHYEEPVPASESAALANAAALSAAENQAATAGSNPEINTDNSESLQPTSPPKLTSPPASVAPANPVPSTPNFTAPNTNTAADSTLTESFTRSAPPGTLIRSAPTINDSQVIPANSQGSGMAIDLGQQAAARAAAELLATSLDSSIGRADALSISQLLARCPESQRVAAVQAYWRFTIAAASMNWAQDEQKRLEEIAVARKLSAVEGPILSTARAAAAARVTDAELEIAKAWAAIGIATHNFAVTGTYSPTDVPLVAPYNTYYSQVFAGRENEKAWEIDRTLPARCRTISDRAATVQSASSAIHYAEQAHAKSEVDLGTVLSCINELHVQRRDFLNAVLQYNLDIAEYAAAAAPAGIAPEKFVTMLIHTKPAERLSAVPQRPANTTFGSNVSPEFNSEGPRSRQLPPPPNPGNDGWTPSNLRPIENESQEPLQSNSTTNRAVILPRGIAPLQNGNSQSASPLNNPAVNTAVPPAREFEPSSRTGQQPDPFAVPPDERYGRYGEGH